MKWVWISWLPVLLTIAGCAQVTKQPATLLSSDTIQVSWNPSKVMGVNTANMHLYYPGVSDTAHALTRLVDEAGIAAVRFPGGTTANFYHPDKLGYGYRASNLELLRSGPIHAHMERVVHAAHNMEEKRKIRANYVHAFARWAALSDLQVLYVANLFSGTSNEVIKALQILEEAGVQLIGVELGNEYYLNAYADAFPDVDDYIRQARKFAEDIRDAFPNLPLSVVGAPSPAVKRPTDRVKGWNEALGQLDFYDAVSMHFYPLGATAEAERPTVDCTTQQALDMARIAFQGSLDAYAAVFEQRPIWVSEWNILGAPKWCGNGIAHAVFVTEMLLLIQSHPQVEIACYHTLLSRNQGFNLFVASPKKGLTSTYNAHMFRMQDLLRKHLKKESLEMEWSRSPGTGDILYRDTSAKLRARLVYNARASATAMQAIPGWSSQQYVHYSLSDAGWMGPDFLAGMPDSLIIPGETIHLFLVQ